MAIILNIDTAVDLASICLSRDAVAVETKINPDKRSQTGWLHVAIKELLEKNREHDIQAVAVSYGPGSYTGLRVGLSAAKGLCFAKDIPLITVSTLEAMTMGIQDREADFFCPMIDARRMEVFTAVYRKDMTELISPTAMLIDSNSFSEILDQGKVLFFGNGSGKLQQLMNHPNAGFATYSATAADMIRISEMKFQHNHIADLAYTEPLYLKEFYTPKRN